MELANLWRGGLQERMDTAVIRTATEDDAADIYQLLRRASHCHIHAGWHLPIHWLGQAEFLVYEPAARKSSLMNKLWGEDISLRACLVATANPAPVAWVQVAAVRGVAEPVAVLAEMLARLEVMLRKTAVTQFAWMPVDNWPDEWLGELGFVEANQVQTYLKQNMGLPETQLKPHIMIRPVLLEELPELVQIEATAFDSLWRLSLADLTAAFQQAFSFDVAIVHDRIVGFQLSTCDDTMAHLVRLTISPAVQKQGIGSALLAHAIQGYQRRQLRSVTLNTQVDNLASQQLYQKFGFIPKNQWFSIWVKQL